MVNNMKAKELAELLMENPDVEVIVDCCVYKSTYDNPYPIHKSYDIYDVNMWHGMHGSKLVIECS